MAISSSTYAPGYQHACTFATADGQLTDASIAARQAELNDAGYIADIRRRAVLSACADQPTVERVCSFVNEARSGIWNIDCTVNIDRYKAFKGRFIEVDGVLIITRSIFQAFINERRATKNKSYWPNVLAFGNVTWVSPDLRCPYLKVPIPNTAVTDGSIDAFFHKYSDRKYNGEDAVVWEKASEFYDPQNIFHLRD
jgi:hypothetical protein